MSELELRNEFCRLAIDPDGEWRVAPLGETHWKPVAVRQGELAPEGIAPIQQLRFYLVPSAFQSIQVRREGAPGLLVDRITGEWPAAVDDDLLDSYPSVHFLEERRTGAPWRLERWYTLAGSFLVYESEQYAERWRPREAGRDWERFIVNWRQVIELPGVLSELRPPKMLLENQE